MLYIVLDINGQEMEKEWHTGDPSPVRGDTLLGEALAEKVKFVQADCGELTYIYDRFTNIPRPGDKRVVKWRGEFARFIVENLV